MKRSALEQRCLPTPLHAKTHQQFSAGEGAEGNALFTTRLQTLRQLSSELITPFITMSIEQVDSEIWVCLRKIVETLDIDRGFVAQSSVAEKRMVCTHFYDTLRSKPALIQSEIMIPPRVQEKMERRECFAFSNVADLPAAEKQSKAYFRSVGAQSHLSIPLEIDKAVIGCLSLETTRSAIIWHESLLSILKPLAEVFALSIERKRRKLEFMEKMRFETLLVELSARFVSLDSSEVDQAINQVFEMLGNLFRVDRCGLIELQDDDKSILLTHAWYGEGREPISGLINLALLWPWSYERLFARGENVVITTPSDLPPEAEKDRDTFTSMGVRSSLTIPLALGRKIKYVIAFNTMDHERRWAEDYISRLRLMGEVLINTLARKQSEEQLKKSYEEIRDLKDKLQDEADFLWSEIKSCRNREEIIGQSEALSKVLLQVEQVAPTNSTVLICGETGTGKELIAQAIHDTSLCRDKIMVRVNCASLPASLVESELFGREKGAYTGALTRQIGRFEMADGSTIFLDEIAELPLELQAKLLRVLQEHTFERLGSPRTIQVNVRVIAATNRNIREEVKKGNFREDLYYRLNVFPITVPPLRERVDDIPMLVWAFVNEFCEKMGKQLYKIAKRDMEALQRYPWPGNVRELRNIIEHAVIVSTAGTLQIKLPQGAEAECDWAKTLEEIESQHILAVLRHTGGRIKGEGGGCEHPGADPVNPQLKNEKTGHTPPQQKGRNIILKLVFRPPAHATSFHGSFQSRCISAFFSSSAAPFPIGTKLGYCL